MAVKRLIIMRHGYCDNDALTPGGEREVRDTAAILKAQGMVPDLIITGTTGRTRETTALLCHTFNPVANTERDLFTPLVRDSHAQAVHEMLNDLPEHAETVLFSGHSETVHTFGYDLMDEAGCSAVICAMSKDEKDKDYAMLHVATADALVLRAENGKWVPEGYITDKFTPTPPVAPIGYKDWRRERMPYVLLFKK